MQLAFEGIANARELGGLLREDGYRIREDVLLRTGRLTDATRKDIKRLQDMGLYAIIDFRDDGECRRDPDRKVPGAQYHHLKALPDLSHLFQTPADGKYVADQVHANFHALYRYLALTPEAQEAYTAFFQILLEAEGRPVLWHCTQGKDRTGVATVLLLTALGYDEETAIREYMLTNAYMQPQVDAYAAAGETGEELAVTREVLMVFEDNIRYFIHCVQVEYGTLQTFLEMVLYVGPEEIRKLEKYLLLEPEM